MARVDKAWVTQFAWRMAAMAVCLGGAVWSACTTNATVGENAKGDGDVIPGAEAGQCGNGIDDNLNGRVDEGCPCTPGERLACWPGALSARGRGTCSDGTMVCPGNGEFSTWSGECPGARLPADEICNGFDDDCDGATDEGCSCTLGEVRPCGQGMGFPLPCKGGQQSCSGDGIWSSCEGAVLPTNEVCGDGVDNDCNGLVDEGCDCVPEAEVCGDGFDNDCDGIVDEACDGGVTSETCGNGIDDDLNGLIDDGCEEHCPCPVEDVTWDRIQSPDNLTLGSWEAARSVWTGKEHLFAYVGSEQAYSGTDRTFELYLARWSNEGEHLGTSVIADVSDTFAKTQGLIWTGKHAVVMADQGAAIKLVRVANGTVEPEVFSPFGVSIAWNGYQVGRLSVESGTLAFDRLDADLAPLASPVVVASSGSNSSLGWTGSRWVVVVMEGSGTGGRVVFLDDSTIADEAAIPTGQTSPMLATNGRGALVCTHRLAGSTDTTPVTCQRYSTGGSLVGSPIVIDEGPFRIGGGGIVWWQCAYWVILPSVNTSRIVRILEDGTMEDVPLPKVGPDLTGMAAYFWYFHSDFGEIEYTPGDLFFATRWFSPYMKSGRMRVSCGPGTL